MGKVLEKYHCANKQWQDFHTNVCESTDRINPSNKQNNRAAVELCRCGIAGWCLEVMFTSVDSIMAGD